MTQEKMQHLEFIQNNISRMNSNSFQIKGIAITIVTALLAIYVNNNNICFLFLPIFPTILFWFLDSYYLQQERKLRGLYSDVAGLNPANPVRDYDMPISTYTGNGFSFIESFLSKTVVWVYLTVILLLLFSGLFLIITK